MPLVRFEVKNEYGLGDHDLYKRKEEPKEILDGVAVAGLVGILRQLGDLAEFAADIFHDLHEQVMATTARGRKMSTRIQHIESALPSLEKAIQGQRSYIHHAYIAGCDWHANVRTDESQLLCSDLPQFMIDFYEECRDPPCLYLLDKFDSSGDGACLKRYSDPSYFRRALASSQVMKAEKVKRKKKKRGSKLRNRGIQHARFTFKDNNSTQFESPSTDLASFSGENTPSSDTRSKSEWARESAHVVPETRTKCVEQVAEAPHMMPDEPECSGFSAPGSENGCDDGSFLVLHNEPKLDIADNDSQPGWLQQQSAPSTSSVTWDEKTEIVKSTGTNLYGTEAVDRNTDLDSQPQIFETSDLDHETSKVGTNSMEDIVFELAEVPVSCPCGNVFDEAHTGTGSFMDTTITLEPEIQKGSEYQTEQEFKSSNLNFVDLESRACKLYQTSATNSDFYDAQAPPASCGSLNNFGLSDGCNFDHIQSANVSCHTPKSNSSVGSGCSESHIPCVPGISVPENLMDETHTSEPEIDPECKCQTKQELEYSDFSHGDLEPRAYASATISDCFDARAPTYSCNVSNNFVLSDGLDHVQSTYTSCHSPNSDSSVGTGYSKSRIPCEPGINVSELLDGGQSPESSIVHEQDVLVNNGMANETSKSQDCVTYTSNPSPVCFWTNGGILGVEPSKPPVFSINANLKAVDRCNESKLRNTCLMEERDQSDGDFQVRKNCKDSSQGPLMSNLDKFQEAERDTTIPDVDLTAICSPVTHSSNFDKNLKGISTSFSGLAQKFLSNSFQGRILVAQAGLSTSSQLVNSDFNKLQEILRQNDHMELPKRVPNVLCEPTTEDNMKVGSSGPVSSGSPDFGSSSPPLEHMKISFHPMNCLETSELKLEFSSGNLHEGSEDLVFPSFQLIPGTSATIQDSTSESDDDTFCRSSVYSFDDLQCLNSDSNSELWEEVESSESQKHGVSDDSCGNSVSTTSTCDSTKFEQKDRCSIADELEHVMVEKGKIADLMRDPPLVSSVACDRDQQQEIYEPQPFDSIYSTSHSPNELMSTVPVPPLRWRVVKEADKDHSVEDKSCSFMEVVDHLDAKSRGVSTQKQQEQEEPMAQCKAEDQQMLSGNRGQYHDYNTKEQNGREDLLYQIRSKSFNLRCTIGANPSHDSVSVNDANNLAITKKAHAFPCIDGGIDNDNRCQY